MDTEQHFRSLHQDLENLDEEFRRALAQLSEDELNWKPTPDSWSIAECLDHLIILGRRYLANINRKADRLGTLPKKVSHLPFKPKLTTRLFIRWVGPGEKVAKIKAPAVFQPSNSQHSAQIIEEFYGLHKEMEESINKVKEQQIAFKSVTSPVNSLIRFSMGDVFLMLLAHERRHLDQIRRVRQMIHQKGTSVA